MDSFKSFLDREVLAHGDLEFFKANGLGGSQRFQSIYPIKYGGQFGYLWTWRCSCNRR